MQYVLPELFYFLEIIKVQQHKTGKVYGGAKIVLYPEQSQNLQEYVKYVR